MLNPLIQLIISGAGGAPGPKGGELRMLKAHGLQLKRKLDIDAKEKEIKRQRKDVHLTPVSSLDALCDMQKFWHLICS